VDDRNGRRAWSGTSVSATGGLLTVLAVAAIVPRAVHASPQDAGSGERAKLDLEVYASPLDAGAQQADADAGPRDAPAASVLSAAAVCADRRLFSVCFQFATETSAAACFKQCIEKVDEVENARLKQVQAACEERVIADNGNRPLACGFGRLGPREDDKLNVAFGRAWKTRSSDIDAIATRIFAIDSAQREALCTEGCNRRGKSRVRAPIEGPGLVRQYKVCMVNADSTMQARKFALYERDLYNDFIGAANSRCRATSKCDWLEEFSTLECTYNSR
jgi:hypothetical protein